MDSNCSNPSLVIDFDNLPKIIDNDTNGSLSIFSHRPEINLAFFSIVDRLDQEVDESYLLLPQKFECGDGMQFVNRVFGGDFTSIWEFPWYYKMFNIHWFNYIYLNLTFCLIIIHRMALLIYNTNTSELLFI